MERRKIDINELDNAEFYEILDCNGTKSIQIHFYCFRRSIGDDDPEEMDSRGRPKTWAKVDGTFLTVPLEEFFEGLSKDEDYIDNELWACTKQYEYHMSEDDIRTVIEEPVAVLDYSRLMPDTPYGEYVSLYKKKDERAGKSS